MHRPQSGSSNYLHLWSIPPLPWGWSLWISEVLIPSFQVSDCPHCITSVPGTGRTMQHRGSWCPLSSEATCSVWVVLLNKHLRGTGMIPEDFRCDIAEGAKVEEEPSCHTYLTVLSFLSSAPLLWQRAALGAGLMTPLTSPLTSTLYLPNMVLSGLVHQRIQVDKYGFWSTLAVLMAYGWDCCSEWLDKLPWVLVMQSDMQKSDCIALWLSLDIYEITREIVLSFRRLSVTQDSALCQPWKANTKSLQIACGHCEALPTGSWQVLNLDCSHLSRAVSYWLTKKENSAVCPWLERAGSCPPA